MLENPPRHHWFGAFHQVKEEGLGIQSRESN